MSSLEACAGQEYYVSYSFEVVHNKFYEMEA
jgi:hypothetical protein